MVAGGPGGHSVTRAIFETLNFFSENVEKIVKKCQNFAKVKICPLKYNLLNFHLLNIVDKIFKISTIVETLVTLGALTGKLRVES